MRLGYALMLQRRPDASVFRTVPLKPRVAGPGDLTNFVGLVVENDPVRGVLTLETQDLNSRYKATDAFPVAQAQIPYTAFKRIQRVSKYHQESTLQSTRPTRMNRYTRWAPYKTRENIQLR
jgi:hypothetical protein